MLKADFFSNYFVTILRIVTLLFYQAHYKKQYHGTCRRNHNGANQATGTDSQQIKYYPADYRTYDTDNNIPQQSKAATFHEYASQPAGYCADSKKYNQACYVHLFSPEFIVINPACQSIESCI